MKKNNKEEFYLETDKYDSLKNRIKSFLLLRVVTHISAIIAAVCGLIPISLIGLAITIFITIIDFIVGGLIYQRKKLILVCTPIFIIVGVVCLCSAFGIGGALDTLKLFAGLGNVVAAIMFFVIVEFFGWISYLCVRFGGDENIGKVEFSKRSFCLSTLIEDLIDFF